MWNLLIVIKTGGSYELAVTQVYATHSLALKAEQEIRSRISTTTIITQAG